MAELTEEEIKDLESMEAELREDSESYGSPDSPPAKDSFYKFAREILKSKDSTKVANLDSTEIGYQDLTVRGCKNIANYCDAEGLDTVKDYFNRKAEIVLSTSMSKKGFWAQLLVTQIKKETKFSQPTEQKRSGWGFFGKKNDSGDSSGR